MSSLYSQPLTRRSTQTDDSSPLHTPQDDIPLRHHPKSRSRIAAQDGVRVYSPSSATSSRSGICQYEQATPLENSNPYFPQPSRHRGSRELSRRGTTKELIGRFEAIGGSPTTSAARGAGGTPARRNGDANASVREAVVVQKKDKGRSPIRQSFRNLLSVFKKNKPPGAPSKEGSPQPPDRSPRRSSPLAHRELGGDAVPVLYHKPAPPSLTLQIPQDTDVPVRVQDERIVCISPVSAHTGKQGPLLYLSRIPLSNIPAVWMECSAQLHSTHILVTWETSQGNPAPKLVPFTACTDVRSLAPGDVNETERAMLPAETEWKVFELLFEGRARERFAARSLTDRATWVSAIWDAILLAQERRTGTTPVSESAYSPAPSPVEASTQTSSRSSPTPLSLLPNTANLAEPEASSPNGSQMSRFTTATLNRDLPPVPAEPKATQPPKLVKMESRALSLSEVALSTLPAPPVTPSGARSSYFSRLDSPARTLSPSIRNLDQRSVVKQRLAHFESSSPRPQSPASPMAGRLGSDSPLAMRRQNTAGSSRTASIVESYMGRVLSSPVSARSDGLTTLASRMGSPPVRPSGFAQMEHNSRLLCPPKEDIAPLSPASNYSADHEHETEIATPTPKRVSTFQPLAIRSPASPDSFTQPAVMQTIVPDNTMKPMLIDIQEGVENLRARSTTNSTNIVNIRTKVDEVLEELRRLPQPQEGDSAPDAAALGKIEELRTDIKDQFLGLRELVVCMLESEGGKATTTVDMPDLADLREKLDKLLQLSQLRDTKEIGEGEASQAPNAHYELADMLALLKDAEDQRAAQLEQQTDSIRYLNELNTWLEAFVKHGTSQIEGVAAGVQQLCRELGSATEQQDDQEGPRLDGDVPPQSNLISDLRKLLTEHSQREQSTAELHATLNGVAVAIHENLQRNAETRNSLTTHTLASMLDQQRRDQENMLKALAAELSNDIRGERLRFVEAMKEATAINVQVHVEEFKKELTREVRYMTQEVTRLERERQGLEQHIADLFAFYAKQKQGGKTKADRGQAPGMPIAQLAPPAQPAFPGAMPSPSPLYRRPLPSPAPSQMHRVP
ncbi:hypothetical protein C8Q80DRAFT_1258267 [Daedaleopsis nitida]|nr:hypothetical protein C8Q80DRAFT_1258267 [Daedaleopsis nitida]